MKHDGMKHIRATMIICVCALVANAAAYPLAALARRSEIKESKIVQKESTSILIRRIPHAYFYPFSLWPLPKYPIRDPEPESHESFQNRRNLQSIQIRQNKR